MSSLSYGPIAIGAPDCPVSVAAGRVRSANERNATVRFVSGWGATLEEAARNCQYEADETYFAQVAPLGRIKRGKADALVGEVISPLALLLVSDDQYRSRKPCAEAARCETVPKRWRRTRPLDWIASEPMLGRSGAWIPARYCVLDYPGDESSGIPAADSNGLATGDCFEDACVRAFCEIVERDATAIWWYNQLIMPRFAVVNLDDDLVRAYSAWSSCNARELRLLRLTLDFPVHVVAAVSSHLDGSRPAMGFAAGPTVQATARRAVGELAQCEANLHLLCEQARRSGTHSFTAGALRLYRWHESTSLRDNPHLRGGAVIEREDEETSLNWAVCDVIARSHNLKALALDLTGEGGPPLARVVAPGLRSTKPQFKQGRLFDVPRLLGLKPASVQSMIGRPFPF